MSEPSPALQGKEPSEQQRQLYANLMHEAKVRLQAIDLALQGHLRVTNPFVREFCWLQLRMLCELVALSCLVAHGDVTFFQPNRMGRAHSAGEILNQMSRLRPHFYPAAIRATHEELEDGKMAHHLEAITPSPLSKEDLLDLYGLTHRHLHRGSLKGLLDRDVNAPWDTTIDAPEIIRWGERVNRLLSHHFIWFEDTLMVAILRNASDNNKVQVAIAQALQEPTPDQTAER